MRRTWAAIPSRDENTAAALISIMNAAGVYMNAEKKAGRLSMCTSLNDYEAWSYFDINEYRAGRLSRKEAVKSVCEFISDVF